LEKYINYNLNHVKMGFICEMCIQLNLEEQTGLINKNELKSLNLEIFKKTTIVMALNLKINVFKFLRVTPTQFFFQICLSVTC